MNSMKMQKDRTLKDELPRSEDQWRNNSGKNEGLEPKQEQHPVVDEDTACLGLVHGNNPETMKGWSQSKNNTQF